MNKAAWTLVAFAGGIVWAICEAQTADYWYRPPARRGGVAVYGGYPRFSSTAAEGAAYGMAEMTRARGEAAESTSRAINNLQDAQSKYLDNSKKWTETYLWRKHTIEAEQARNRDKRLASRDKYLAAKKPASLPRLSPGQLDPATGKLSWPPALLDDQYAMHRTTLEELFKLRVHTSTTPDLARKIETAANDMKSQLQKNIRSLRPNDYIAARKFLDGLAYEGSLAAG